MADNPLQADNQQSTLSPDGLLNQLGNAVSLVCKQDQVVWAVFGVFWAANAVLLVALFTTGDLPKQAVGVLVSLVGLTLSIVWLVIEYRAIAWLRFYEAIVKELEQTYLHVPSGIAITGRPELVKGYSVRRLMLACPLVSGVLWGVSAVLFAVCA